MPTMMKTLVLPVTRRMRLSSSQTRLVDVATNLQTKHPLLFQFLQPPQEQGELQPESNNESNEPSLQLRLALVTGNDHSATAQQLYAAIGSQMDQIPIGGADGLDQEERLAVCTFYRAKGAGFVSIGTNMGNYLLDFTEKSYSEYTQQGRAEADHVAQQLGQLVGYDVAVETNFGADY